MNDFYAPKGMQIIFILITVERLARFIRLSVSRIRAEKKTSKPQITQPSNRKKKQNKSYLQLEDSIVFFIKQRAGYMHPSNSIGITTR